MFDIDLEHYILNNLVLFHIYFIVYHHLMKNNVQGKHRVSEENIRIQI